MLRYQLLQFNWICYIQYQNKYKFEEQMGNTEINYLQQNRIVKHPKFIESSLKDSECMQVLMKIHNEIDFYKWQKNLNLAIGLENNQFFLLPKAYEIQKQSICDSTFNLKIQYQSFQYILQDQIWNRNHQYKYFEEQQIWYLLYGLVNASYQSSKVNKKIGDIRPLNIFLNDEGQIKIASVFSWPTESTNFQKTYYDKIVTYLSPQQLSHCKRNRIENINDEKLSQTFSIGLTLLHSSLLKSMEILYKINLFQFQSQLLQSYFQQLLTLKFFSQIKNSQTFYSDSLKQVLIAMCQMNPKQRISFEKVYDWIKPFENYIIYLKPFKINKPPIIRQRLKTISSNQFILLQPKNKIIANDIQISQRNKPQNSSIHTQIINNYQILYSYPPIYSEYLNRFERPNYKQFFPQQIPFQKHQKSSIQRKHSSFYTQPSINFQKTIKNDSKKGKNGLSKSNKKQEKINFYSAQLVPRQIKTITYSNSVSSNDLLRKIDQQLKKSKELFP